MGTYKLSFSITRQPGSNEEAIAVILTYLQTVSAGSNLFFLFSILFVIKVRRK